MVKEILKKWVEWRAILEHLRIYFFKILGPFWIFFKHVISKFGIFKVLVMEILKKWVKLRAIQEHLRICFFKIFFNHGEENDYEISQIEGHSRPSSNMHFQHFLQPRWKKYGKNESTMVKVIITKLFKLKVILVHLQRWIFKIFFSHNEGYGEEIKAILEDP